MKEELAINSGKYILGLKTLVLCKKVLFFSPKHFSLDSLRLPTMLVWSKDSRLVFSTVNITFYLTHFFAGELGS